MRVLTEEKIKNAVLAAKKILDNSINKPTPSTLTIARTVDLNDCFLKKAFREAYEMGMYQYCLTVKMEKAKELVLAKEDLPMKVIYPLVGFGDQAGFSNSFRKYWRMSPIKFREKFKIKK
jgi:AraC family transcriptional regulator, transcriptional activator of the genes for pyochelin and ferripyochelin receptors